MLASISPNKTSCHLTAYGILRGAIDQSEITKSIVKIKEKRLINFIPWGPAAFYVNPIRQSPYAANPDAATGLILSNHTSVTEVHHGLHR